ncbi:MAG: dTDP-4-dehydrorhamnose reductase [Acidobacteria bacterium]|nr:dTDP-4-dehydrorhamnose reductase [Acidobacteriota bacterium]MCB9397538.1 dTDP-4-dehydrorhamnose reductase [Acidobacteriota bacterium]
MRVLVVGANGALGSDLLSVLGQEAIGVTHAELEIADPDSVSRCLDQCQPSHVINTAAFHQVPLCESRFEDALKVNTLGATYLARACQIREISLCHISTDYVFDGLKGSPYTETDCPAPLNAYAISKLAGEHAVLTYCDKASVVRSCGLYGRVPTRAKGGNFVTTLVRLGKEREKLTVVNDEWVTPTYTLDLAKALHHLLQKEGRGIFHITQSGAATWFDLAEVIFSVLKLPAKLEPVPAAQFQNEVKRPQYSILDNGKFNRLTQAPLRTWQEALRDYLSTF